MADGVDPDEVIMPPAEARRRGLTSTVCFPAGNLCPEGSVIKATSIDPSVIDDDGVYRKRGPARVFTTERDAIAAIKGQTDPAIKAGDVIVLIGRGPLGCGMEETYQITSALKYLSFGKEVALVTDARFSGVSTGACIGHVGPEALAGGPIAKVRDGDIIEIEVDRTRWTAASTWCRRLTAAKHRLIRYSPHALPIPSCRSTTVCPTTRGCGRPCNKSAAVHGGAASTTSTKS